MNTTRLTAALKDKGATLVALRDVPAICNALMARIAAARDHATAKKAA